MNESTFRQMLEESGYSEIATSTKEPAPTNDEHAHEFSVLGLVNSGEFVITCDGVSRTYRAGDQFEMEAGRRHCESVGPEGASITSGRKY